MNPAPPEEFLTPGSVIKIFTYNTDPPKFKRCIVVGLSDPPTMVAVLYFNTALPSSPFIQHYQIPFSGEEEYIDHACYLDCAQLYEESAAWIRRSVADNKEDPLLGRLPDDLFGKVIAILKDGSTISHKLKKKYGIV